MSRKERRAAEKLSRKSPPPAQTASAFAAAEALFQSGLRHHQEGRINEADSAYRSVLMTDPQHVGALTYLGILAHQLGHSEAGIDLLRKAIAADRRNAEPHFHLGRLYADLGRDDDAIRFTTKAIRLRPEYADAHTNLGALLLFRHETANAIMHFSKALDHAPSTATFENLAKALLAAGRLDEALDVAMQGLDAGISSGLKAIFVEIVQSLTVVKAEFQTRLSHWLGRALAEHWSRPRNLASLACKVLIGQQLLSGLIERITASGYERTEAAGLFADDVLKFLQDNDLLSALLTTTPIVTVEIERLLTQLRFALLMRVGGAMSQNDEWLPLTVALAQQCFINDYVFDQSDDEATHVAALRETIAARLAAQDAIEPFAVAVLACYVPLHTVLGIETQSREWPSQLQPLITQQVTEPREERTIRPTISALTRIGDDVSLRVQAQYEQHPYPRWTATALDIQQVSIDAYLRALFPRAPYRAIDTGAVSLLVAGCGTGLQVIERAAQLKLNDGLAIDLSLSSLAYAIRKSRELGLAGITYAQADILSASDIGRTFSIIESLGVLHHLRDPLEGWRRLAALLQPGGVMHIALYSAIARRDLNEARAMVTSPAANASPQTIRQLRRTIMDLPPDDPRRSIIGFTDFFSTSECRDLLFHVEEHQFGIPDIASFLEAQGFDFIGFETRARDAYLRRFPDDIAATRLDNWHLFELENPATFSGMYQFWVQKRT